DARPLGGTGPTPDGSWWIDLGAFVPGGRLATGQSTTVATVTFSNLSGLRLSFRAGLLAMRAPNSAPGFDSPPVETAAANQLYEDQVIAHDPDGDHMGYVLAGGPSRMTVDPDTGLIQWTPEATSPAQAAVVVEVFDARGGHATQSFAIAVAGVHPSPV